MSNYRRFWRPGGCYFLTQVTQNRATFLCDPPARDLLRATMAEVGHARPFTLEAAVLLPDHFHLICRLPPGDAAYPARLGAIKAKFTRAWVAGGGVEQTPSASRSRRRGRGVWQRRFWEHTCRDVDDFKSHLDYVHYNPVKHGYARCPHEWPFSSFPKWVARGVYPPDWRCVCDGRAVDPPDFSDLDETAME